MNFPPRAGRVSGWATPSLRHAPRAKLQRTDPGSSPLNLRGILFKQSGPALLNRDSARQWKEYGDECRGFSIGFAPRLFLPDQTLSPRANENAFVGRVTYGDEKTTYRHRKVIERVAEIAHRAAVANRHLLRPVTVHSDYINAMPKNISRDS
jgi:hypothetical protein